ncbi:hypothetical protein B0W47_14530 [Komagataeibacter nataicola]|uniref:DUF4232 domain-containing protein n=1 Tax=Komagataeibacter nataicola TaxID=265960 RepID=A0A9N7CZA4_9PROT|nr:DUF4232 domain-containing protein [Komagataeibacter nataicola]AQU88471.1 hypothetical protein B0W47_14530 [Komagataeibacter nataicola]PYD67168.1 hypothetical protein CDI09_04335 [Komagataeibacter nataicola]WEQ54422.1 DUF4232 domain-containing protein [Komagataeibacter nataicola]WNM08802.1 DUF4232 domain-containing protein [Komagataeibacter nataicola]GBR17266.1 hypothetical protein AA0616_1003 [Komagataeibacter nataicola NRIC 0616]
MKGGIAGLLALTLWSLPLQARATAVPDCKARQMAVSLDDGQGAFNGMMHGGTWLVVRNTGARACSVAWMGPLSFADGRHHRVAVTWRQAVPAPVMVLPAGGQMKTALRWVSGDVFDPGACTTPATLVLPFRHGQVRHAFAHALCGPASSAPAIEQQPWTEGAPEGG